MQAGGAKLFSNLGAPGVSTLPSALLHDASGPAIDGGLTKSCSGMLGLTVASTYTGGTVVMGGGLQINGNGGLGNGNVSVLSTAISLMIGAGVTNPFNGAVAGLSLAGGGAAGVADAGYLDLSSGANITVNSLVLGAATYTSGVFTSANAPEYILGSGTVTVIPEPGTAGLLLVALAGLASFSRRRAAGGFLWAVRYLSRGAEQRRERLF